MRSKKDRIPLSELLNQAIERTGYDAALLAEFLGRRKLANLKKLVEMARQFDQGDVFTLKDFVTRLQTSVLEETDEEFATTLPESGEVVRLMSIHQSKGLEFPVVFVADIDRKGPPHRSDAVLHAELGPLIALPQQFGQQPKNLALRMHSLAEQEADAEETIRLFYVACTRAADYLILSTGLDPEKTSHSPWLELVESRFDLQTGLLKVDSLLGSSAAGTAGRETVPDILIHHVPCEARLAEVVARCHVPVGEIPGRVLAAEPGGIPQFARVFSRDLLAPTVISVSRLEAIDAELGGIRHARLEKTPAELGDDFLDFDLATSLGTLLHAVLERADFQNPASWSKLLDNIAKQSPDGPVESVIQQARQMLERFFNSPLAVELAQAKTIHREIEFLLPWAGRASRAGGSSNSGPLIAGIIDLLIETPNGWQVLDYKTGEFPRATPVDQLLAPYELQLGLYAFAVEQWFGAAPCELSLITFRPEVHRISLPWSQSRWQQIRQRIDRAFDSEELSGR